MNNKKYKMTNLKKMTIWEVYYYSYFCKKTVSTHYHKEIGDKKYLNNLKSKSERYSILYNLLQTQKITSIQTPYIGYLKPAV